MSVDEACGLPFGGSITGLSDSSVWAGFVREAGRHSDWSRGFGPPSIVPSLAVISSIVGAGFQLPYVRPFA